jgi:cytochrome oxidase Cu insertion factor (SCO1/SenC/PrrC family)
VDESRVILYSGTTDQRGMMSNGASFLFIKMRIRLFITVLIFLTGAIFSSIDVDGHVDHPKDLPEMGIDEKLSQYVPLDLTFHDENGHSVSLKQLIHKPTVLAPVYYHCPNVCSFLLQNLAGVVNQLTSEPGKEYQVIAVSFDENEKPALALEKKKLYFKIIE